MDGDDSVNVETQNPFIWELAFASFEEQERKRKIEKGASYISPSAPTLAISTITDTGKVTLTFSEDMWVIPDLALV